MQHGLMLTQARSNLDDIQMMQECINYIKMHKIKEIHEERKEYTNIYSGLAIRPRNAYSTL